jgi:hypothetical protein
MGETNITTEASIASIFILHVYFPSKRYTEIFHVIQLCTVLKLGHFGESIKNTWEFLKCGAEEDQFDGSCEKLSII